MTAHVYLVYTKVTQLECNSVGQFVESDESDKSYTELNSIFLDKDIAEAYSRYIERDHNSCITLGITESYVVPRCIDDPTSIEIALNERRREFDQKVKEKGIDAVLGRNKNTEEL